ncbi:hypothetical protein NA57DRAFT_73107 [Rhizodiscina lignyota]|uniref:Lipocalin-like domain-containing protein n=1 Tax=Rhizodiscina lignyota TaxID=1504668 RepID=A0A9P4MBQ9_9PEZI|nr:hypothetical protein NA57DRAFT_73107 [Rhizodiscina lignyota]
MSAPTKVSLRAPTTVAGSSSTPPGDAPSLDWMLGTWHVTHATLPMWKSKCNVRITYTKLPPAGDDSHPRVDDLVEYQSPGNPKTKSVNGISRSDPKAGLSPGWAWHWRGKGLLKIASSNWEVLGYGEVNDGGEPNSFIVTYFTKTLFTPAGIDVYSRNKKLSESTLASIKGALEGFEDPALKKLSGEIFEVPTEDSKP